MWETCFLNVAIQLKIALNIHTMKKNAKEKKILQYRLYLEFPTCFKKFSVPFGWKKFLLGRYRERGRRRKRQKETDTQRQAERDQFIYSFYKFCYSREHSLIQMLKRLSNIFINETLCIKALKIWAPEQTV